MVIYQFLVTEADHQCDVYTFDDASRDATKEILEYLISNNCRTDDQAPSWAAYSGNSSTLLFLRDIGFHLSPEVFEVCESSNKDLFNMLVRT